MKKFQKISIIILMTAVVFAVRCTPEENKDSDVRVTTYTPQNITSTTAVCGGDVIVIQGLSLTELGVCWGKDSKPTVEDSHRSTSKWSEPYVCTITGLEPGTKYHVRAYALRGLEYYYGDDKSFTTEENGGGGGGSSDDHDYVDLGLPSGTLWATCNIGADTPEGYGDYFAWGETHPRTIYNWSTYQYCMGNYNTLTKYCSNPYYGYNGFTDSLIILLPEDDAATANWGNGWRMPTNEEWQELYQNTTNTWRTTQNGVNGRLFTAPNGNSLFLPAAGRRWDFELLYVGSSGYYWSSSLDSDTPGRAWNFRFISDRYYMANFYRSNSLSVRAVRSARQN